MKPTDLEITCSACCGRGVVKLPDHLVRTLAVLKKLRKATVPQIKRLMKDKIGFTAFNNRLETLLQYGMVARERNGKAWVYRVV